MQTPSIVRTYVEVTKPPIVLLLAFTCLASSVLAVQSSGGSPSIALLVASAAIIAASAGCNATTGYIDRDIDAIMNRTRRRPIPSGRIDPPEKALAWGLMLIAFGLAVSLTLNLLAFACLFLGVLDNVVVYSLLLKRKSPLNIILGGFSGGLPALFGWAAVTGEISILAILLAALVVIWIPGHIWSLALFRQDDYRRARVPMLPTVVSLPTSLKCITGSVLVMVPLSFAIFWFGKFGMIYLATSLVAGTLVAFKSFGMLARPSDRDAYVNFKISSPYLFVLFLAMIVDQAFKIGIA